LNNDPGHPGQPDWPSNGKHYKVALLQADGRFDLERSSLLPRPERQLHGKGDGEDLYRFGHVTAISSASTPNTNGYQGGSIKKPGHHIFEVSRSGPSMSFRYDVSIPTAPPSSAPTAEAAGKSLMRSAQFSLADAKKVTGATNLLELSMHIDEATVVHIHADTSARSQSAAADVISGVSDRKEDGTMWTESIRTNTLPAGGGWSRVGSSYATQLAPGDHTIYWKVVTKGAEVTLGSGTLLIQGYATTSTPPSPTATPAKDSPVAAPVFDAGFDAQGRHLTTVRSELRTDAVPINAQP
jgi:hypothetical protein